MPCAVATLPNDEGDCDPRDAKLRGVTPRPIVAIGVDGARAGWVGACLRSSPSLSPSTWETEVQMFDDFQAVATHVAKHGSDAPAPSKHSPAGAVERLRLLRALFPDLEDKVAPSRPRLPTWQTVSTRTPP